MSRNNIKRLVDVKPGTLQKVSADVMRMVESAEVWDLPFEKISLQSGTSILQNGKIVHIEPCVDSGPSEDEDYLFTDMLIFLELDNRKTVDFILLKIATAPDEYDLEHEYSHMIFSIHVFANMNKSQLKAEQKADHEAI